MSDCVRTKDGLHEEAAGVADITDQQPDAAAEEFGCLAHLQSADPSLTLQLQHLCSEFISQCQPCCGPAA